MPQVLYLSFSRRVATLAWFLHFSTPFYRSRYRCFNRSSVILHFYFCRWMRPGSRPWLKCDQGLRMNGKSLDLAEFCVHRCFFLLRLSPFGDMHSMRKNTTLSFDFATYNHSDSQNLTKSSCFCTFLHMLHICIPRQREIIIFVRVLSYKTAFLFFSIIQHRLIDLRFLGLGSWPWCDFSTWFVMRSRRCRKYYIDLFLAGSRPWFDFCIFQFLFITRYIVVSIARLRFLKTRSGAKLAPPQI